MDRLPERECEQLFAGESPLRIWREFRGLAVTDVRRDTGIAVDRLEQIEAGKGRKMSEAEERRLSRALNVDRASLRPMTFAGCSALDVDEDEILRQDGDPERFKERKLMEHKPVKRLE